MPINSSVMRFYFLPILLFVHSIASSQWSADPAVPMRPCTSQIDRLELATITDETGNWYLFWIEARQGPNSASIYGQKVDPQGQRLWEADGRLIHAHPNHRITYFSVARVASDRMMVAALPMFFVGSNSFNDTLWVSAFDNDANDVWPSAVPIRCDPDTIRSVKAPTLVSDGTGGAFLSWHVRNGTQTMEQLAMNRIDAQGEWMWGDAALAVPGSDMLLSTGLRIHQMVRDGGDGVFLAWSRQVGLAPVYVQRMSGTGAAPWSSAVDVSFGYPGIGPGGPVELVEDGEGGVYLAWSDAVDTNEGNIHAARVDADGSLLWTPSVKTVCAAPGLQRYVRLSKSGSDLFFVWEDWRASISTSQAYAQRIAPDGTAAWAADGVDTELDSWPNVRPQIISRADGGAYVVATGTSARNVLQRISADGSTAWAEQYELATSASGATSSDTRRVLEDQAGGMVVFWLRNPAIFGTSVRPDGTAGTTVSIDEHISRSLSIWPVPANEQVRMHVASGVVADQVITWSADGRIAPVSWFREQDDVLRLDVRDLTAGIYIVRIGNGADQQVARFIKE